ncbi:MAG TPA: hypothetical protein VHA12_01425 [Candidatus Nanoarchaeia archaeon]|nr:hypothetical protein [Candidatus Nanoarchaeia archaeon]
MENKDLLIIALLLVIAFIFFGGFNNYYGCSIMGSNYNWNWQTMFIFCVAFISFVVWIIKQIAFVDSTKLNKRRK